MKEELNIAAILKEKPLDTKLWTDMFGEVTLDYVSKNGNGFNVKHHKCILDKFLPNGKFYEEGTLCIYPSRNMQDWSKFTWKKGDVLVEEATGKFLFFYQFTNDNYTAFSARYELGKDFRMKDDEDVIYNTKDCHAASEHDAQIACQKLHESLSPNDAFLKYIRKQPEFKDGDVVAFDKAVAICRHISEYTIYFYACISKTWGLMINDNSVSGSYRLATDSEKQRLFDALAKEGKHWNPDTKQIEDLPKKCEFKPFDKVLVRMNTKGTWQIELFSHLSKDEDTSPYHCIYGYWKYCLPYNEETKHLLGTTNEWKGGEG